MKTSANKAEANFLEARTPEVQGICVRTSWIHHLLTFLMVMGPGLIVMEADNDAGAVSTYVPSGAQYGTHLLWLLLFLLPCTYFIQEMAVRLGIATGKGHAAMIYQRFGKWWGLFSFLDLQVVNLLTLVTEFAAIALASRGLGIPPAAGVLVAAIGMIAIVVTGSYRRWERAVVVLWLLDLYWLFMAFRLSPPAHEILHNTLIPSAPAGGLTQDYVLLVIAIVGTTIAPWQVFFQQSCIADQRLRFADLNWSRLDTFLGACFTIVVAGCMMLVGNYARVHGVSFEDPAQMADALFGLAGNSVRIGIFLLMVNAALLGTTAISLSSAWAYGEVKGLPHSLEFGPREAPGFYMVYLACVVPAAGVVLIPRAPLQLIILSVQVLAGIMLPSAIIFLQLLLNDRELLGEQFVNKPWNNVVNWTMIVILFALSLILAVQVIAPNLFPTNVG
jgi:Mn2+/Fe2+ NRAMP family transporter